MPIELSPQCPKAETLLNQIRRTIWSHVEVWKYYPSHIELQTKVTEDGFVLYVYARLNGEYVPTYVRRHHDVKPVPFNESELRQRVEYVVPRLMKRFECKVTHWHESIQQVPSPEGLEYPID
jgi:hypothetical protein